MSVTMTHKEWMKLTYGGITSIRSSKLKLVDAALEKYHKEPTPAKLDVLRQALMGWMGDKGANWKTSVRNGHNAVETLHKQVMGLGPNLAVDAKAKKAVEDEAHQIMLHVFRGAQ